MTPSGLIVFAFAAAMAAQAAEAPETRVKLKALPRAVQKSAQEQSKGAIVRGYSKEVEHGQTYYEMETTLNGHSKDILMDASGKIVEVEEEVSLASVPAPVKTTLEKEAGGQKLGKVESVSKDGNVAYETVVRKNGKKTEIKVASDGTLVTGKE